jgi:hypothetical protein
MSLCPEAHSISSQKAAGFDPHSLILYAGLSATGNILRDKIRPKEFLLEGCNPAMITGS